MSRVYVGNLDSGVTERDLEDEFRVFGALFAFTFILSNEGLGEAYDGDIAFASALETFGGGHNDPIGVALGEGKELEELNWEQMKREMKQHLQSQPLTCFAKLLQPHIPALTGGSLSLAELLKTRLVVRVELNLEKLEGNGSWLWFPFEVGGRVSEFHYWREPTWGESDPVAGGRFGQCCCGFKFG
ncbi:hypothetical protein JHK84_040686 [Glycine max]|nr:hypothetical protein JHK84_040686 [Glycine max]